MKPALHTVKFQTCKMFYLLIAVLNLFYGNVHCIFHYSISVCKQVKLRQIQYLDITMIQALGNECRTGCNEAELYPISCFIWSGRAVISLN